MQTALSLKHTDAVFLQKRRSMLYFPSVIIPFVYALFWVLGGGKGERYATLETAANKPGAAGFNAQMPNAKSGSISSPDIETPGYGKAATGQALSIFTHTKADSVTHGLKAVPVAQTSGRELHQSTLAAASAVAPGQVNSVVATKSYATPVAKRSARKRASAGNYYYSAPGSDPYGSGSDRQLDAQLKAYETSRTTGTSQATPAPVQISRSPTDETTPAPATVRLSDNLTASRLSDASEAESPFLTAPTGGSRPEPTRAVLSGGNYGHKKAIAWMIPVVVHEDQTIKDGQQVKLRLLKEITADGLTIPINTVLYALCQLSNDRLRLTVQNLQLHGQLIPLDLDVYDTDGSPGINVPGLGQSSQINGNLRTSAIQGAQLPGLGGLANTMLSSARMGATQSMRQTTIRLRSGYNLFLKAQ